MTTPAAPAVFISPDCNLRAFVRGVVLDAKRCAARGDHDARQWLITEGAQWVDIVFDIHPDRFIPWALSKKRKPARRKIDPRRWDKYKPKIKTAQEAPGRKKTHASMETHAP